MRQTDDKLERRLGLFPVTNIVIANMIGAGIFTTSGLLMGDLQNPIAMIVLWVVGGVVALCGALSYGELGAAMPHAGGEYLFLSRLYSPVFGFLSGWVSFIVGFSAPIAASSLGFSEYFTRAFPQIMGWSTAINLPPALIKKGLAVLVIALFTAVHLRGIEFGAKIQNGLTVLKVTLIVGLVAIGFALGNGDMQHFSQGQAFVLNFAGWKTLGLSLMWIMFGYSGWNASVYIGSEIKNPLKTLPRSLFLGTGIVLVLYVALNILFVYAASPTKMQGVISIGGLAMRSLFGGPMEFVTSVLISFALFSSLSAFIILGPRVYYAMAKDGYFFRFVSDVHPKFRVPTKAILLQAIISIIMVMSGTFDQILTYMGFSLGIFPILAVLGLFRQRRGETPLRLFGFPFVQLIYIFVGLMILILSLLERPVESSVAILTVLVGIPIFFLFKKQKHITNGGKP
ncbi:amino acid permease [candidate division KSB1 bacterium]|nr:amino acid permease [candidate division KSB1 bacterium]RQW00009.1 MAG: amino acid permease [candidate division KSB1 bacterium]